MKKDTLKQILFTLLAAAFLGVIAYVIFRLRMNYTLGTGLALTALAALICAAGMILPSLTLKKIPISLIAAVCLGAMAVRLLFFDYASGDYNTFLGNWVQYFRKSGGFSGLRGSVGDYNMPYLYFLALFSYSPLPDLYLIKFLSVFFDYILAYYFMRLASLFTDSPYRRFLAFTIALFLPTVVLNGANWGQCDSIYAAFALAGLYYGIVKRPIASLTFFALSFSFKLQVIFILPVCLAFLLRKRMKLYHLPIFPAVYLLTCLPALIAGKPFMDIISVYWSQVGSYSAYLSLNAPSVFMFFKDIDNVPLASYIGVAAALVFAVLIPTRIGGRKKGESAPFALCALCLCVGIPFFLPHMHDRYFFIADVLSVVLIFDSLCYLLPAALITLASLGCYIAYFSGFYVISPRWFSSAMLIALLLSCFGYLSKPRGNRLKKS